MERGASSKIGTDQVLPMLTHFRWNLGIPIAGKIHKKTTGTELKKIDVLGAARGFADKGEPVSAGKRVDDT